MRDKERYEARTQDFSRRGCVVEVFDAVLICLLMHLRKIYHCTWEHNEFSLLTILFTLPMQQQIPLIPFTSA